MHGVGNSNWRDEVDADGFPIPNEDRYTGECGSVSATAVPSTASVRAEAC